MAPLRISAGATIGMVIIAVAYQWWLKEALFVSFGIGRVVHPIETFPYLCRRLEHPQLEACGDLWLDEPNRVLYAACAGRGGRNEWNPSLSRFNASGRKAGGSDLMAIYIDEPRKDGLFKMHRISPTGHGRGPGDGHLDLSTFDVEVLDAYKNRFWLLNQRPIYDANGKIDQSKVGANITVDVYDHRRRDKTMRYVGSTWSPTAHSANKIAIMGGNNFVISNDHSAQTGLRKKLDPLLGGGSLVYYDDWLDRYTTTPKTLPFIGGIVRGMDDRVYVPSMVDGKIRIFELQEDRTFGQAHAINIGMPVAGLSVDSEGDIWAVGRSRYDPTGLASATSIVKIEKFEEKRFRYVTTKILEDKEGKFLSDASVVRHDAKTHRIFVGGLFAPFVTVCEPRT